jgi:ParB-like chromosome segregation protein Spo0J
LAKKSAAKSVPDEQRAHPAEVVPLASLKPHQRNYKRHPPEQIEHLCASLRQYGQFRNVVVARDSTILAGHGVVQAMAKLGWAEVTVVRLDLDPKSAKALKLVALDNELPKFAETDDRALTDLLREVSTVEGLLGTGFDDRSLEALVGESRFTPGTEDEQGRLDQKAPITCPHCNKSFTR